MYPEHPDTIVLKNSFYPQGLSELSIWNHYQKYKDSILLQAKDREIMIFIKVDGSLVVRRGKSSGYIFLDKSNYDSIITGRSLSLHATMRRYEDIAIVDIDTDDFQKAKQATKDCYEVLSKVAIFSDKEVRFSGKSSFHIMCKLKKKMDIDTIRFLLQKIFTSSSISDKYTVGKKKSIIPNIDLFRNTYRGAWIMRDSLSVIGLKCTKVEINNIDSFSKERAIIM